jgi:fucose permease
VNLLETILKPESIVAPLLLGQLVLSEHGEVNGVEELQLGAAFENCLEKPIQNFATAGLTSFVLKLRNFEIEKNKT